MEGIFFTSLEHSALRLQSIYGSVVYVISTGGNPPLILAMGRSTQNQSNGQLGDQWPKPTDYVIICYLRLKELSQEITNDQQC